MARKSRDDLKAHDKADAIEHGALLRQVLRLHVKINESLTLQRSYSANQEKIMSALDDIRAQLANANTALDGIRQDITDIKNSIPNTGGMNAEDTAAVLADVTALATKLQALDLENPTPPTT